MNFLQVLQRPKFFSMLSSDLQMCHKCMCVWWGELAGSPHSQEPAEGMVLHQLVLHRKQLSFRYHTTVPLTAVVF